MRQADPQVERLGRLEFTLTRSARAPEGRGRCSRCAELLAAWLFDEWQRRQGAIVERN